MPNTLFRNRLLGVLTQGAPVDATVAAYRTSLQAVGADFVGSGHTAFNTMVTGLKADGVWTLITDMHLLCGVSTLTGVLKPLKTSVALSSLNNTGVVAGDYIPTGVDCGINDSVNTPFYAIGGATVKTLDAGAVTYTQNAAQGAVYCNTVQANSGLLGPLTIYQDGTAVTLLAYAFAGGGFTSAAATRHVGSFVGVREAGQLTLLKNGTQIAQVAGTSGTVGAGNLLVFASAASGQNPAKSLAAYWYAPNATLAQALLIDARVRAAVQAIGRADGITQVYAQGDSITYGIGVGVTSWVTYLQQTRGWAARYLNYGINGRQASDQNTANPLNFTAYVGPDGTYITRSLAFVWLGTNDLFNGATPAAILTNLQALWAAARAAGHRVIAMKIMPRADTGWTAGMEANRVTLNALIAGQSANWDALLDPGIPLPNPLDSTQFQSDKLHLTDAGEATLAAYIATKINPATV